MTSFSFLNSDPRYMVDSDGNFYGPKVTVDGNGYRSVWVRPKRLRLHRVVAEAFVPNLESKPHVAHWDGDKSNNTAANLRWATPSENSLDKRRHGTNKGGVPKLDWEKVQYIRSHPVYLGSQQVLAAELQVDQSLISMVITGKIWKEYQD